MPTFSGAWQLIQEWFVSYISTHIIPQTPQILCAFIKYTSYRCTCAILCLYFQFILCCVQNLTHWTLTDKVSGTRILHSVLNITLNTATTACDRLSKVCSHVPNTVYALYTYIQCDVSITINWTFWQTVNRLGNLSHWTNIEENITIPVLAQLHKVWIMHRQIFVNLFALDLMLHAPHYWLANLPMNPCLSCCQHPIKHFLRTQKIRATHRWIAEQIAYSTMGRTYFLRS